jgi:hypothetical protein
MGYKLPYRGSLRWFDLYMMGLQRFRVQGDGDSVDVPMHHHVPSGYLT